MHYMDEIDSTQKIILVRFFGEIKKEDLAPIAIQTRLMALVLEYKIIFDFSGAQNRATMSDAYFWIDHYYDGLDLRLKRIPVAHIANDGDKEFFEFLETTFLNKGARLRLCNDEQDARAWLSSQDIQSSESTCFDGLKGALKTMCFTPHDILRSNQVYSQTKIIPPYS